MMGGPPLTVFAGSFNWCKRTTRFWGRAGNGSLHDLLDPRAPKGIHLSRHEENGAWQATWAGKKPLPERVHFKDAFVPAFDPVAEIKRGANASLARFGKCVSDRCSQSSSQARDRRNKDGGRFAASAYEDECLLWTGCEWRRPRAVEMAAMIGIPPEPCPGW